MRYFMISYFFKDELSSRGLGTYFYASDRFPSINVISKELGITLGFLSVFEFMNEQDYKDAQI